MHPEAHRAAASMARSLFLLITGQLMLVSVLCGQSIIGAVVDEGGAPLSGVVVELLESGRSAQTDDGGRFAFEGLEYGYHTLRLQALGFETLEEKVFLGADSPTFEQRFTLKSDPLELSSIVVTGSFDERRKLESTVALSTRSAEAMRLQGALGTADLLGALPGVFADASAGEVYTRVYSRGISISAEDDLGWYYVSLQEDGLPVSAVQFTFFSPDLFHRNDLGTRRLEALRGGMAALTSPNAPGGIFNFLSRSGGSQTAGEVWLSNALQGEANPLHRLDARIGGPLGEGPWRYHLSGFYRYDAGARNTDLTWADGGQLRANFLRTHPKGHLKIFAKFLDDHVNRWTGVAATDWRDPRPAFGQDFHSTALMLPKLSTHIADGRYALQDPTASFSFDTDRGIHTREKALGFDLSQGLGAHWTLRNSFKFSDKDADWQTSIGNNPLGLETFTPYVLSGISPDFSVLPLGQVVFRDARSGQVLARVNNLGILGPFQGQPPSFEYLEGSLPHDAVMGIAPWKKEDSATEWMNRLTLERQAGKHTLHLGAFAARSSASTFTSGSFAYATYEPRPRMLQVTVENPGEPTVFLSDAAGVSNYGGLFYNRAEATVWQGALFVHDRWALNEHFSLEGGLRWSFASHQGEKDRSAPAAGDLDDDAATAFNNSTLVATGQTDPFDFEYDFLSWSLGGSLRLSLRTALFARLTNGHKAPELNYYFNNFPNQPIPQAGSVQEVWQGELGLKWRSARWSLNPTLFWSRLSKVAFSEFVFDQSTGSLFFTPTQFNETTTYGLELEGFWSPLSHFEVRLAATLQRPEASTFTVYDAAGTADTADDRILDFSGNTLPHNPTLQLMLSPTYRRNRWEAALTYQFLGERQGNVANAFQLPAFGLLHAHLSFLPSNRWTLTLIGKNLLNSAGLMNFFGPNEFGSSANAATPDFIAQNPNASFVVFPVQPRTLWLQVGFRF